jgi:hypothetical protein
VTASSAGHLPALIVHPDGTAGQLQVPVSVPLGVGGIPHEETTQQVPYGSTLVLYTDGLVETRCGDVGDQINVLQTHARAIIPTASSLDRAADSILTALLPGSGEPADDVTLLLVRTPGAPRGSASTMIQPGPQHVAGGRRFVRDTLEAWNQAELAPTACLLISELLTNAMRHTGEPIGLRLNLTEHEIIAEISDDHPQLPRRTLPAPADEAGRGLTLVEALADRWGSLPANGSKIVWFALAIAEANRSRERVLAHPGKDEAVPAVTFGDVPVPDGREPGCPQPAEVRGGVRVIPEHVGAEILLGSGPAAGPDDGHEVAAGADPLAHARQQCLLIGERYMDQGVERNHRVDAGRPQAERCHVGLHEPGRGDELVSPADLHGREVDAEHLEPVAC